jgi:TRAP-type uncharacterized transport system substrate-binding protein
LPEPIAAGSAGWRGKGVLRFTLLCAAAALVAALASTFAITYDYRYLRAEFLSGVPGGQYHTLATRLSERARSANGRLAVIATQGSVENVSRLAEGHARCVATFALVQDGTPVPAAAGLVVLGKLPEAESLLLLAKRDRSFRGFDKLRQVSIGIGPENSGTAYLMRQLFDDPDLRGLNVRLSHHDLEEQAAQVAQGGLDLAAMVIQEDSEFLRAIIRRHDLDIADLGDLAGLVARHQWLSLGYVPAGLYDLVRPTPPVDRPVAQVDTLLLAGPCARRAERVALLMLLNAEIPGFIRGNPPKSTGSSTALPLATEARQFFITGEPELADRYFPWLVNLMSPTYWVYLVMAVTILFNGMKAFSRFRLWRIDAAREKLQARLESLIGAGPVRGQLHPVSADRGLSGTTAQATAQSILDELTALRSRCQRQVASFVTPMGDEMFYRYQQYLIEETRTKLIALLHSAPIAARAEEARGAGRSARQLAAGDAEF